MRGAWILAGLIVATTGWAAEAEIEPLEADFLEYLAHLEGDDDDWTVLAEADQTPRSRADSKPAAQAKTPKPNKEAAKPAAEER